MQLALAFIAVLLFGFRLAAGDYLTAVYWSIVTTYWVLNFADRYLGGKRHD